MSTELESSRFLPLTQHAKYLSTFQPQSIHTCCLLEALFPQISPGVLPHQLLRRKASSERSSMIALYKNIGRPSRWQRSRTCRSPSSAQIHQKYIYMWNNSYRTPTERWQKTPNFPKGKKLPISLAMWLKGSWYSGRVSGLCL